MAVVKLSGTFSGTGQSSAVSFTGRASVFLYGTSPVGTVKLERSPDGGTTWVDVSADALGTPAAYALNSTEVSVNVEEGDPEAKWRFNCTAYTSGTINYQLSQ